MDTLADRLHHTAFRIAGTDERCVSGLGVVCDQGTADVLHRFPLLLLACWSDVLGIGNVLLQTLLLLAAWCYDASDTVDSPCNFHLLLSALWTFAVYRKVH